VKFYQISIAYTILFQSFLCTGMDSKEGLDFSLNLMLFDAQSGQLKSSKVWDTPLKEKAPTPFFMPIPQTLQPYFRPSDRITLPEDSRKKIVLLCPARAIKSVEKETSLVIVENKEVQELRNEINEVAREKEIVKQEILRQKEISKAKEIETARLKKEKDERQKKYALEDKIIQQALADKFLQKKEVPYMRFCTQEEATLAERIMSKDFRVNVKRNQTLIQALTKACIKSGNPYLLGYFQAVDSAFFFTRETKQLSIVKINFDHAKELLGIQ